MPNTTSAKKALRQNIKRREHNKQRKTALKKAVKTFRKLVSEQKKDEAQQALTMVYKTADKIAKTNVIKKNSAARIKSRAANLFKKSFSAEK